MSKNIKNEPDSSQLIASAQNGDQGAFSVLLETYEPLIDSMARKFSDQIGKGFDMEDWKQEATVAFCNAVNNFDDDQYDIEFGLFAKICVSNALKSILRRYKSSMDTVLLDDKFWENIENKTGSGEDVVGEVIAEEKYRDLYLTVRKSLSPYENKVWWAYFSGMRTSDIAKLAGKSEKSVSNAIYRIRIKLRQALGTKNE